MCFLATVNGIDVYATKHCTGINNETISFADGNAHIRVQHVGASAG